MSGRYYEGRYFTVYMTASGLMDKVNQHCQKYGLSYSKFAQMAIAEKMEREERERKDKDKDGVKGNARLHASNPTSTNTYTTAENTVLITKEVFLR